MNELRVVNGQVVSGHVDRNGNFVDVRPTQVGEPHRSGGHWLVSVYPAKGVLDVPNSIQVVPGREEISQDGNKVEFSGWLWNGHPLNLVFVKALTEQGLRLRDSESEIRSREFWAKEDALRNDIPQRIWEFLGKNWGSRQFRRDVRRHYFLQGGKGVDRVWQEFPQMCFGRAPCSKEDIKLMIIALFAGVIDRSAPVGIALDWAKEYGMGVKV